METLLILLTLNSVVTHIEKKKVEKKEGKLTTRMIF